MTSGTNPVLDWNDQTFPWSDSGLSPQVTGLGFFLTCWKKGSKYQET